MLGDCDDHARDRRGVRRAITLPAATPAEIRKLPRGTALLISGYARGALVTLTPGTTI